MHRDLLAHSPLLVLPLVAMFVFLAVWVVTAIRAMTQHGDDVAAAARLPLEAEGQQPAVSRRRARSASGRPA